MKGQEPLPYTADEIMNLVNILDHGDPFKYSSYLDVRNMLQKIADRYEYMNMHFNPPKSIKK